MLPLFCLAKYVKERTQRIRENKRATTFVLVFLEIKNIWVFSLYPPANLSEHFDAEIEFLLVGPAIFIGLTPFRMWAHFESNRGIVFLQTIAGRVFLKVLGGTSRRSL